jgi:hypothetical protein
MKAKQCVALTICHASLRQRGGKLLNSAELMEKDLFSSEDIVIASHHCDCSPPPPPPPQKKKKGFPLLIPNIYLERMVEIEVCQKFGML